MTYIRYQQPWKDIFLVDMRDERQYPFSELVEKGLEKYIPQGKKILILWGKKWFATGTICQDCGFIPRCTQCDIAVAVHKDSQWNRFGLCHICKSQYHYASTCEQCGWHDTEQYGVWTQQIAEYIHSTYKISPCLVDGSCANSPKKIQELVPKMQEKQLVVATSLVTMPPSAIQFDIVIVMSADMSLHVPDFQSNRNCFCFLAEVFQKYTAPTFLVQTYNPEHYPITCACACDEITMKEKELAWRKSNEYPPYTQMCVLLYKHEIEERLHTSANKLYQELLFLKETYGMKDLEIYTTPPLVYKVRWKYRYNIILKWSQLRQFMDVAYSKLRMRSRWFKVDREPKRLL